MRDAMKHGNNEKKLNCERCENVHSCKCVRNVLKRTRAHAHQLAVYNEALTTNSGAANRRVAELEAALESTQRLQNPENAQLKQQLFQSESARFAAVRRCEALQHEHNFALHQTTGARVAAEEALNAERPRVHNMLDETLADADELADENEALAADFSTAHRRVVALEAALESTRRLQNTENVGLKQQLFKSEAARGSQNAEITRLKQRLFGSETERGMQNAEIVGLQQRLRESENARITVERRGAELHHAHNIALRQTAAARVGAETALNADRPRVLNILEETRADADELADENDALVIDSDALHRQLTVLKATHESSQRLQNAEIAGLKRRLSESETARFVAVRRVEELQHVQNIAFRRTATANAALNAERPRVNIILAETRAHAEELTNENKLLVENCENARRQVVALEAELESTRRLQTAENVRLQRRLHESESVRMGAMHRAEEFRQAHDIAFRRLATADATLNSERPRAHNILEETRADANELADENEALATDSEVLQRRVMELEAALESSQRLQNFENARLKQRLGESETARWVAVRHAEEFRQARDIALRRIATTGAALNAERPRAHNMLEETRADANELAHENETLLTDSDALQRRVMELEAALESSQRLQNFENVRLKQRLSESERARQVAVQRAEEFRHARDIAVRRTANAAATLNAERPRSHNILEETLADADELADENEVLATDSEAAHRQIAMLQAALESTRRLQHVENARLKQQLGESERARVGAVRRAEEFRQARDIALRRTANTDAALNTERPRAHNMVEETLADANELADENEELAADSETAHRQIAMLQAALESTRRLQHVENARLKQQLSESERARAGALRRAEEFQRARDIALRRTANTAATLNAERPRAHNILEETRADADELADENEELADDSEAAHRQIVALQETLESTRHLQHAENARLKQQLGESERARVGAVRRAEEFQRARDIALRRTANTDAALNMERPRAHNMVEETRADANELADENEELAADSEAAHRQIAALQETLESTRQLQMSEVSELKQRLNESETARLAAVRRAEELQHAQNIAVQRTAAADAALNTERPRVHNMLEESRAHIEELADENEVLATDSEAAYRQIASLQATLDSNRRLQIAEIAGLERRLRECETARMIAVRRGEEIRQAYNIARSQSAGIRVAAEAELNAVRSSERNMLEETYADADELANENEELATNFEAAQRRVAVLEAALESTRLSQNAEIAGLQQRLRESETARINVLRRAEELQRSQNNALRQTSGVRAAAEAELNTVRSYGQNMLNETRANANDLANENEVLASDSGDAHRRVVELEEELESSRQLQNAEISGLRQQLSESETARFVAVRRAEEFQHAHNIALRNTAGIRVAAEEELNAARSCVQNMMEGTRANADELANENEALVEDCGAAQRQVAALEAALESTRRSQNVENVQLKQRLFESENVRCSQNSENMQLKQRLCASDTGRLVAVRRAEELRQAHHIALRQTAGIRVVAEAAINAARKKVQNLRQVNASLNVRCGAFMQQQARLIASLASVAHELDVARGHARMMKRIAKTLSTMPPKQAVAAVRAARAEAREARIRERSLAFAKNALELANRAERHRIEYEQAFREQATRSLGAKAKDADSALNELQEEYRVVVAECATLRRRFADARDDAAEARIRIRQLERTNSSLATQLGAAEEAARATSVELEIAEQTASQSRGLSTKVARLRARCGELLATNGNEADAEENDSGDGTICVICMDILAEGESAVRLDCMHVFHRDCIMQCLSRMKVPSCPLDRVPVTVQLDTLHVWSWSDNSSPVSERLQPPVSEQLHPPVAEQLHPPVAERLHPPVAEQVHPPAAERLHPRVSERLNPPVAEAQ